MPTDATADFAGWFRQSAPYIRAHRGRTFVIYVPGAVLAGGGAALIQDVALLTSLGIHVVVVHGAAPQAAAALAAAELPLRQHGGHPVVDAAQLARLRAVIGTLRLELEAAASASLPNTPLAGSALRLIGGNLLFARPLGVRGGVDHLHAGLPRRLDVDAVRAYLREDAVVVISPLGVSPTGENFLLDAPAAAALAAGELQADKLLLLTPDLLPGQGALPAELDPAGAQALAAAAPIAADTAETALPALLLQAAHACRQGVRRAHLIPAGVEGALLRELFTRDGCGTLVTGEQYEALRPADIGDIGGLLALLEPLEEQGVLVRRSREQLELQIGDFVVMERDNSIIACASLHRFEDEQVAEIACVAVHPAYREARRGRQLMQYLEQRARAGGVRAVFVLTTHTAHWFSELGFEPATPGDLPVARQALYNWQRNSKIYLKQLAPAPTQAAP